MKLSKSNTYIIKKSLVNIGLVIIGAILASLILNQIQRNTIKKQVQEESTQILEQLSSTLEKNRRDAQELTEIYHALNQSTVKDLKEILQDGVMDILMISDDSKKEEILSGMIEKADIPFLYIMDQDGNVFAAPDQSYIKHNLVEDKLLSSMNLKTLIQSASYVKEQNSSGSYYFYSEPIHIGNQNYYLVFGTDATVIDNQLFSLEDVTRVIENVVIGNKGFVFAIDTSLDTFIYYEDEQGKLSGENYKAYGLNDRALEDQYAGEQTINGTKYYCITKDCNDYTLIIASNKVSEMYKTGGTSWKWSTTGFVIIAIICLFYSIIVRNDYSFNKHESKLVKLIHTKSNEYLLNLSIVKRIIPVVLLGVIMIFGISFYTSTMVDISKAITSSNVNINELENNFDDADVTKEIVKEYYENQYLSKARILAYLFEEDPSLLNINRNRQYYQYDQDNIRNPIKDNEGNDLYAISNSKILQKYCDNNRLYAIYLYDDQGRTIATNQDYWYFNLSLDTKDQSYPFREILDQKIDCYIQDMGEDEQGKESQYIGTAFTYYTTIDSNGETLYVSREDYQNYLNHKWDGNPIHLHHSLLQIALNTDVMDRILTSTDYEYLLDKSTSNNASLVLFDSSEDHKILYSPRKDSIGKTAEDIGLGKNAFSGNYIGFQKANGLEYFIDIQFYEGYYIGTAILKDTLFANRLTMALISAAIGFVFIILMSGISTITNQLEEQIYEESREKISNISDQIMFMISTPGGNQSMTEKALSRWDNKDIPWKEKTPEQKLLRICFIVLVFTIINIFLFALMVGRGRINDTILSFIISGNWDKGFNIFALSACGLVLIFATLIAEGLNVPIQLITSIFGTKSETIGHLLASVIKYAAAIFSIFYCLYLVGFDSYSLMTSAGILSLVIGLGSQSLIKDVVAGIFIIFEGDFRVGDIVTINGYRGQVLDIGLRTTKIMSSDYNIKIINNNDVNGVVNMTRILSICSLDIPVSIDIPPEYLETVFNREFPLLNEKIEEIEDGPYYKGILKFNPKIYTIKVTASCKEQNISKVRSKLNKELIELIHMIEDELKKQKDE